MMSHHWSSVGRAQIDGVHFDEVEHRHTETGPWLNPFEAESHMILRTRTYTLEKLVLSNLIYRLVQPVLSYSNIILRWEYGLPLEGRLTPLPTRLRRPPGTSSTISKNSMRWALHTCTSSSRTSKMSAMGARSFRWSERAGCTNMFLGFFRGDPALLLSFFSSFCFDFRYK